MSKHQYALDYIDVATRLVEFRNQYPDGSLQQADVRFIDFGGASWVVFTAAAYRTPDDPRPGHGTAWEPVPGKTSFTRDSELQNAETSAWGRAIVAALAADTKKGIASAEEVRNRSSAPQIVTDAEWLKNALDGITESKNDDDLKTVGAYIREGVDNGKCSPADVERLKSGYRNREALVAAHE